MGKQVISVGSLFAGIGGIEKGLEDAKHERYEFKTAWQVECDPYAQAVLKKHWPDCGRWDDVRTFPPAPTEDWRVDVVCGGFPCTDISNAGKRAGIDGEQSGLWREYIRIVRTLRPSYVVVENVAALLDRGVGRVLGDLAASGYDAEWEVLSACAFGAPHSRERLFIIAHASSDGRNCWFHRDRKHEADSQGQEDTGTQGQRRLWTELSAIFRAGNWDGMRARRLGRSNGISDRVDRLRTLGNAVVPEVATRIGGRILVAIDRENFTCQTPFLVSR